MLHIAVLFHEKRLYESYVPDVRRKPKVHGYQISKTNYRILKLLIKTQVTDIPRSRIVEYHYIQVDDSVRKQGSYFILPITEEQLPRLEAITTTEHRPRVYLWRDNQWWTFPQLEIYNTGEMTTFTTTIEDIFGNVQEVRESQIEKTGIRIRASYAPTSGPGFALTTSGTPVTVTAPADLPTTITGNGMVLEWKRGYEDKQPVWWLRDEQRVSKAQSATYRHYATLKATPHARWSKSFGAWYYTGGAIPPQKWLELVGYQRSLPAMPPELTRQIEQVLAADEPLIPLKLLEANVSAYDWNYGNPQVWALLENHQAHWNFYVANGSLTERALYGYQLHLDLATKALVRGEWVTLALNDLSQDEVQRDLHFVRQSLRRALEQMAARLNTVVPAELGIPTDAECQQKVFAARHQAFMSEIERKRQIAAELQAYHAFQAGMQVYQRFTELSHHLHHHLALPAMATPALDDPWG